MHAFKIKIREDGSRSSIIKGLLSPYLGIIQREYSDGKILDSLHRRWYNILLITNKRASTTNLLTLIEVVTYFYLPKNYCIKKSEEKKILPTLFTTNLPKKSDINNLFWFWHDEYVMIQHRDETTIFSWFELVMLFLPPLPTSAPNQPIPHAPVPTLPNKIKQKI